MHLAMAIEDMKRRYGAFAHAAPGPGNLSWIDSWTWHSGAWHVTVLRRQGDGWKESIVTPEALRGTRAFEPSSLGFNSFPTENFRIDVPDLSVLSTLIEPRELIGPIFPGGRATNHAIYAIEYGSHRIFVPAFLLIDRLWLWSARALPILLTPNSLEIYLGRPVAGAQGLEITASRELASSSTSQETMQRIAWLAQSTDAQRSWRSVLSNALQSRLDCVMPRAGLKGWTWGVRLPQGILVCELSSCEIHVSETVEPVLIRMGNTSRKWPPDLTAQVVSTTKSEKSSAKDHG
jgi:hypothetical protein